MKREKLGVIIISLLFFFRKRNNKFNLSFYNYLICVIVWVFFRSDTV